MKLNNKGLTLIELMVAMAISLVAFGLIYQAYAAQQRARTREQLVVEMQQNARSALALMRRELRMSGYDPRGLINEDDRFQRARHNRVRFTLDLNNDGDIDDDNEYIEYRFLQDPDDDNEDGIADAGAATLKRKSSNGGSFNDFAYNIVAVAFAYAFDDDLDGALDTYPGPPEGVVIWAYDSDGDEDLDRHLDTNMDGVIDTADNSNGDDLDHVPGITHDIDFHKIRAVRIWLLARTRSPIPGHIDNQTYVVGRHHLTPANAYKHCLLETMVFCRNMAAD